MTISCEYCHSANETGTISCKNCGAPLPAEQAAGDITHCPSCGRRLLALGSPNCSYCGKRLPPEFIKSREGDFARVNKVAFGNTPPDANGIVEILSVHEHHDDKTSTAGAIVSAITDLLS